MPLNPPRVPTKQERVVTAGRKLEDWLDDHADIIATFLMGGILGYLLGVN